MRQHPRLLGVGIYTRAEAARLLRMTPSRVTRWIKGYTYVLSYRREPVRRRQPAVVETDLPQVGGTFALSFLELMELRIVKALVDKAGVSLQEVRKAAEIAAHQFDTQHPFATRPVYVGARKIFTEIPSKDILELTAGWYLQIQSRDLVRPFLEEIEFDQETSLAKRWHPFGRGRPIVLDPDIAFGAPTIEGTAVRTDVVAGLARVTSSKTAAKSYRLTEKEASAGVEFEKFLADRPAA